MRISTHFIVIGLLALCLSLFTSTVSAHHIEEHNEIKTRLTFRRAIKLIPEIGFIDAMKVVFANNDDRGLIYHQATNFESGICEKPNFWAVPPGDPYISQGVCSADQIRCNVTCPPERQLGLTCGGGHHCCKPESDEIPSPAQQNTNSPCNNGVASSLQYCSF